MSEINTQPANAGSPPPASPTARTPGTSVTPFLRIFDPAAEVPNEPALFEGLMFANDLVVWLGREKHRKTNILLQLAISAALGRDFLTFHFAGTHPARIVFIDYESRTGALKRRYESIGNAMALTVDDRERLRRNLRVIEVRKMRQEGGYFPRFPLTDLDGQATQFWKQLIADNPADVYVIDPMRCFHVAEENDSKIESLLERMRKFFRSSGVIISHHMRKRRGDDSGDRQLSAGMREWSDGARGSGAIKAHADVIVCQERIIEGETEHVYLGAFMKDGADIEPIPLVETGHESFFFKPSAVVPQHLQHSYAALTGDQHFATKSAAVQVLQTELHYSRATAFRHVRELAERGFMVNVEGGWKIQTSETQ